MGSLLIWSQEERKLIDGAVQFQYDDVAYENIIITNLNSEETATTNILGQFSISVMAGDILEFKGMTIFTEEFYVQQHNADRGRVLVLLEPLVIPMIGLEVKGFKFSGILEVDVRRMKVKDSLDDAIKKMGLPVGGPRDEWAHINKPIMSSLLSLDIDALGDAITGERKRKIALYNYNKKKNIVNEVRAYFTDEYFTQTLLLPIEEIDPFIFTLIEVRDLETLYNSRNYYTIMLIMNEFQPTYMQRMRIREQKER